MYLLFTLSITLSGIFQESFELLSIAIFVKTPKALLLKTLIPPALITFIAKGLGGGIATVASFVPVIWFLYFFLTVIESSGYMARGAFIADRFFRKFGLPGKAFIPLIIGFGCNVPAIISTRVLEQRRDRIITIMMAPFMSCSARLSVYALFCAAFFKNDGNLIVFSLYIIGILAAVLTGFLTKILLVKGHNSPFIMELPQYSWPSWSHIFKTSYERTKGFAFGAGKLIVIVYFFISSLSSINIDGNYVDSINDSVLASAGKAITPLLKPIGVSEDNWPATVSIITGTLAKEVVVGTLNALYENKQEREMSIEELVRLAFSSISHNFSTELQNIVSPLWLNFSHLDIKSRYPEHHESSGLIVKLEDKFTNKIAVFSYLLFILLYFPCVSVFAAIVKELNWRWAVGSAFWSTGFAYIVSTCFYNLFS